MEKTVIGGLAHRPFGKWVEDEDALEAEVEKKRSDAQKGDTKAKRKL